MKNRGLFKVLWIVLLAAAITLALFFASGCHVLKSKRTNASDSTRVIKSLAIENDTLNSGRVVKNETKSKGEYERTTMRFDPNGRDTNIIKIFNSYPLQPYEVIHEKGVNELTSNTTDSGWYHLMQTKLNALSDSLSHISKSSDKSKESETKGIGLLTFFFLAVGVLMAWEFIKNRISKYKVVKK